MSKKKIINYIKMHKIKTILLPIILLFIIITTIIIFLSHENTNNTLILNKKSLKLEEKIKDQNYYQMDFKSTKKYTNLSKYKWVNFKNYSLNIDKKEYDINQKKWIYTNTTYTENNIALRNKISFPNLISFNDKKITLYIEMSDYYQPDDNGFIILGFNPNKNNGYKNAKLLSLNLEFDK